LHLFFLSFRMANAALSRKPERVCEEAAAVEVLRAERALARLL
jgi:hypothetical protein